MRSRKTKNSGMDIAIAAASMSSHPLARSAVANYERCKIFQARTDISDWLEGEIPFGFIEDGAASKDIIAYLKLNDMNRHCLIIGPSGVGKSNLARILAAELMEHVPLMIFDRAGDHVNAYPKKTRIFPIRNLRINPNEEPPGVPYEDWLEIYSSILIHSLILTDVSRGSFVQLIRHSNEKFPRNSEGLRSSIYEQRLAISDLKPKSFRDQPRLVYWSRIEDRFDNILTSALGDIFSCYRGHDLVQLLNENIVFDCKGVSSQVLRILIPLMIAKIYCYRLYNEQGGRPLHGILLEEAENIYGKSHVTGFLENPLDDLTRRVRGRGEFLIVINQTCTTLSAALRSNVYIQFMLGATNVLERTEMGRSIGLKDEQWEEALQLDTPRAFVSIEGKSPLLVWIPEYIMPEREPNAENVIVSPENLSYVPVPDSFREQVLTQILSRKNPTIKELKDQKEGEDKKKVLELLHDIALNPFKTVTSRTNLRFGKSRSELFRIVQKAKDQKLITLIATKATKGPGQKGIFLELTKTGIDLLAQDDLWKPGKPYYEGKMGFSGALLLHSLLIPHFEAAGRKLLVEGIIRGSDCDLGVVSDDGTPEIAVELSIHTSASQELVNIRRNLSRGWKQVICVVAVFEQKMDMLVEDEEKTASKIQAFKEFFKENLSDEELKKISVANIKNFRISRKNE